MEARMLAKVGRLEAGHIERWESLRETIRMLLAGIGLCEASDSAGQL